MSDSVTITIPGTIDRRLTPNARPHWATKRNLAAELKERAYYVARKANIEMWEPEPPLTLHILVAWEKGRKLMDDDNLVAGFKAARDGIAVALGIDDKHLRVGTVTQIRDPEKRGFIKVAIEEAAS